jgi:hypothetical protein
MAENERVLDSSEAALIEVEAALARAAEDGKWMAAVWSVKDGVLCMVTRTTWDFPVVDVPQALNMVRESLQPEKTTAVQSMRVQSGRPLKIAPGFAEASSGAAAKANGPVQHVIDRKTDE